MGVMNLTPDSFSDGNQNLDLCDLVKNFSQLSSNSDIVDLGAHSTAPMNSKISSNLELQRFRSALKVLSSHFNLSKLKKTKISIDTYRPRVFEIINDLIPGDLIFNDVSGVIDNELCEVLQRSEKISYVLCHNEINDRESTINHMRFSRNRDNYLDGVKKFFDSRLNLLEKRNLKNKVILDCTFGFAKNYDQNILLFRELENLNSEFHNYQWLFGISKKSFLRKMMLPLDWGMDDKEQDLKNSEYLHRFWLQELVSKFPNCILRVHHPSIAQGLI